MKTCVPSVRGRSILLVTALWLALALRAYPVDLLVSNNNDSGAGSLRQAIVSNNATAGGNTIIISNVVTGTITLTGGELFIDKNLTILGPGAKVLAINGNAASRVLHFSNCVATVSGLTITNGATTGSGGGIANNRATLTISNCLVTGNAANNGGGIYNLATTGRSLALLASTVSRNSAIFDGGGIESSGTMTVINSTIFGNSANAAGGGIRYSGSATLTVTASTIASNSAPAGGGIRLEGSFLTDAKLRIGGTILQTGAAGANISSEDGEVTSTGYNLSSDNASAFLNQATDLNSTDPLLGPLRDNGGPTPTLALKVGSPAIDKSKSFALTADQRGQPRSYDNPDLANAAGGDGADIGAYEASELRIVNAQKTGAHLRLDFPSWFGTGYEVQSRSDLATGNWVSLPGSTPGNGGIVSVTVSNTFGVPQQFYRIHTVPCTPGTPGCGWATGDVVTHSQVQYGGSPSTSTAAALLAANFGIYAGLFEIGLPANSGFSIVFTSGTSLLNYLPSSGAAAALNNDLLNTSSSSSGGFGGEVAALKLNVDFIDLDLTGGDPGVVFGDLHVCGVITAGLTGLNGQTVRQVLAIAHTALGGGSTGYNIPTLSTFVGELNAAFLGGSVSTFAQEHLVNGPCP